MDLTEQTIDEYTLARFLAGTLPDEERRDMIRNLTHDVDSRELLRATMEALEAATEKQLGAPLPAARSPRSLNNRTATLRPRMSLVSFCRYSAAALVLMAVGVGARLSVAPAADAFRSSAAHQTIAVEQRAHAEGLSLTWEAVREAYQYRVVVWDPEAAAVVGELTTGANHLDAQDKGVAEALKGARRGRSYQVRVEAIDDANRLIRSSSLLDVTPNP